MTEQALRVHPGWGARRAGAGPEEGARDRPRAAAPGPAAGGYRVEHRGAGGAAVLGHLPAGTPRHHTVLAPWASHLRLAGQAAGKLVLVEAATGVAVASRRLAARPARPRGGR